MKKAKKKKMMNIEKRMIKKKQKIYIVPKRYILIMRKVGKIIIYIE